MSAPRDAATLEAIAADPIFSRTFWLRIRPTPTGCWLWRGHSRKGDGYGRVMYRGRQVFAHRVAFRLAIGPIPADRQLDHLCRVRNCMNPEHLEGVTHAENIARGLTGIHQRNKTHCPQGHAYTSENTYWIARSQARKVGRHTYMVRRCRRCHLDQQNAARAARRAVA
jgi:hypothetical protein